MHLSISSTTSTRPPHPRWGFDINTCPQDIEVDFFPIFVAVAFKGMELHLLLFDVATVQYLAKTCCQIPY